MPTYAGFDVLDDIPDPSGGLQESSGRGFVVLDPGVGAFEMQSRATYGEQRRTILWKCLSRPDVTALRAFLDARKGRLVPFWLPSFARDLVPLSTFSIGAVLMTVGWRGYTAMMFPVGPQRRHIRVMAQNYSAFYTKITAAAETPPTSEDITTLDTFPVQVTPSSVVSIMRLCRLDADEVEMSFDGQDVVEARIPVVELPFEVPA